MFLITLPFSALGVGDIRPKQPVPEAASTDKPSTGKEEGYFRVFPNCLSNFWDLKATFDNVQILSLDLQFNLTFVPHRGKEDGFEIL